MWACALVMSAVEFANVGLVYALAGRAQGGLLARRAVLLYALCPLPVWFALGWFDPLAVLAMLVSVLLLVKRRAVGAGVAVGVGVLVKVSPGMLVLAAPLALGWRAAARFGLAVVVTLGVLLAPFLLTRPDLLDGLVRLAADAPTLGDATRARAAHLRAWHPGADRRPLHGGDRLAADRAVGLDRADSPVRPCCSWRSGERGG